MIWKPCIDGRVAVRDEGRSISRRLQWPTNKTRSRRRRRKSQSSSSSKLFKDEGFMHNASSIGWSVAIMCVCVDRQQHDRLLLADIDQQQSTNDFHGLHYFSIRQYNSDELRGRWVGGGDWEDPLASYCNSTLLISWGAVGASWGIQYDMRKPSSAARRDGMANNVVGFSIWNVDDDIAGRIRTPSSCDN